MCTVHVHTHVHVYHPIGEDYSVASSDVVLLEGESSKSVPIYVINDMVPELEETFRIELINQTTGGALLGELTRAIITILPSDDPFGAFGKLALLPGHSLYLIYYFCHISHC